MPKGTTLEVSAIVLSPSCLQEKVFIKEELVNKVHETTLLINILK